MSSPSATTFNCVVDGADITKMKANHLVLAIITLLLMSAVTSSQGQPKAEMVDEFGELCSDEVRSRIDSFFMEISDRPNSVGYIVGLANASMPGRYQKFVRLFRNHIAFRNFYPEKVIFFRGPDREDTRLQFWLVQSGASFSDAVPAYVRSPILAPTLFDASAIDAVENGDVIFGEGGEPCDFGLDLEQFAKEFAVQTNLDAYLVTTSDRKHSPRFVRRVLRLTRQELLKTYGIPSLRIKSIYRGAGKVSEMQLWMVPKGMRPPARFTSRLP